MSTVRRHHRTLWEQGRQPGRLVVVVAAGLVVAAVLLDIGIVHRLSTTFDVAFVLVCVGSALAVRRRDFFTVAVLPPLTMTVTMVLLAIGDRAAVTRATDGPAQSVVSGLAHHAHALVVGYGLTLLILALRQVAARNAGSLRRSGQHRLAPSAGSVTPRMPT